MDWENHLIKHLQWSDSIINREAKEHVAREIAATAKDGDVIGAGSGSTVYLTLFELSRRIREEHLHIEVIPASLEISMTCIQLGIPQTTLWNKRPDWTFDGADEVDPQQNLIKGRGGAMFKEKLLIRSSRKTFIIIDPSKRVNQLGSKFPIPVEVFPDSLTYVEHELQRLGASEIVPPPCSWQRRAYLYRKRQLYPRHPFQLHRLFARRTTEGNHRCYREWTFHRL